VWLYFRFTLNFRDVEDLLAERGIEVSYETIRQWVTRFGPAIARNLRSRRTGPYGQWHLDEMFVSIGGKWMYLWRAVDVAMSTHRFDRLFRPRSVALIGASTRERSLGRTVLRNLREAGFSGNLHAVNPNYKEIDGFATRSRNSEQYCG
jgi:hypothetical protein